MAASGNEYNSNLVCQRCTNPLKFNLPKQEFDEISDVISHSLYLDKERDDYNQHLYRNQVEQSVLRKVMVPVNMCDLASDFMVVGELSSLPLENSLPSKMANTFFDLKNDTSIDHAVCEECCDYFLNEMESEIKSSKIEIEEYKRMFVKLKSEKQSDDLDDLKAELMELRKEEAVLEAQLHDIEVKERNTKELLKSYQEESDVLKNEEKKYWQERCQIAQDILSSSDKLCSTKYQILHAQARLNKLENINVFNTTFHIWHNGHFGTINNYRLGRLPKEPVEWPEINAAWGQTVLLLHSLATKINLIFDRYKLVPYGSHSYIISLDNKGKDLPLYCLGGNKYVLDDRFDHAMVAFLDCLQQFKEKVAEGDKSFHLPYRIHKGKIEDRSAGKSYSIKIHLNSQEQWTKALKFMLTNLKWALAWVSTQFS